jgi:hypothetical protein
MRQIASKSLIVFFFLWTNEGKSFKIKSRFASDLFSAIHSTHLVFVCMYIHAKNISKINFFQGSMS